MKPFFISIPHSGERVPDEASWLMGLDEITLMYDVDRFVDKLYAPVIKDLELRSVIADWHRYAIDLNRTPDQYDRGSVEGASDLAGKHLRGLHWQVTTIGEKLLKGPMTMDTHEKLVEKCYTPFHQAVQENYHFFEEKGFKKIYHLDAHSMPSVGTDLHKDPGETRAEVVVSDCEGKSCESEYRDLVVRSYEQAGFEVKVNWPYIGGGITRTYGHPEIGHHAIQVELSRALYMNEKTKELDKDKTSKVTEKISKAISLIYDEISS